MTKIFNDLFGIFGNLYGVYSLGFLSTVSALLILSSLLYLRPNPPLEKCTFWIFAFLLTVFSALRPLGVARDDLAYLNISKEICAMSECFTLIQSKRDWGWYSLIGLLKSFLPGAAALMALSAIGTLIQLFIIDRLCKQKLLALTLFIPLTYIYFDFTLLRAGSALTIYFLGFFLLVNLQKFLGSSVLLSSYLFHSQGIFSIVILPFSWVAKNKYLSTAIIIGLVACIYLQWTPTAGQLRLLSIADSKPYWDQYHEGLFSKEKLFPIANLLIIGYLIFLLLANKTSLETDLIQRYSLASILLAIFLAWFFAPIHAAQTRLFDFYIAPLVFLAGNLKSNKYTLFATLGLVILLYIRIELIHNWMIG